jgi:hypothetical protein
MKQTGTGVEARRETDDGDADHATTARRTT